jgi:hypothetical protein
MRPEPGSVRGVWAPTLLSQQNRRMTNHTATDRRKWAKSAFAGFAALPPGSFIIAPALAGLPVAYVTGAG